LGVSNSTYCSWRKRYRELSVDDVKELRRLREENAELKCLVADKELEILVLRDVAEGKFWTRH